MKNTVNGLLDILVSMNEKENKIADFLELMGGLTNEGLLYEEMLKIEKIIVHEMGGDDDNLRFIKDSNNFYSYLDGEISRDELIENIQYIIKKGYKGPITSDFFDEMEPEQ